MQSRVQDYRGADSVVMAEEQKPAADGEVTVYAAPYIGLDSFKSKC